ASPRRKELLEGTGLKFEVDASDYEEDMSVRMEPHKLARFLSREKAKAIAERHKNALIIAADTFIVFKGRLLGKPHTGKEATKMLEMLSSKSHSVITGYTVLDTGTKKVVTGSEETKVYFKRLSEKEIRNYVRTKEPLDKAGAYAIQGLGAVIVERIEGDFFNVVGLPLSALVESLKKFGVQVL
ncbi:MAG TPA: Maf family protein, partial [Dissulfurispiraceae bacterium]